MRDFEGEGRDSSLLKPLADQTTQRWGAHGTKPVPDADES